MDSAVSSAESYAMDQVGEFISDFAELEDESFTWNETTQIKAYIELYDPNDKINGYIFRFETDGADSGFMQIGILEEEYYVVNLGFEGEDILTEMIASYNSLDFSATSTNSTESVTSVSLAPLSKVYYIGGFNYYIYDLADNLIDLSTCEVTEGCISQLASEYELYKDSMEANLTKNASVNSNGVISPMATPANHTVLGYYTAEPYMKTMSYYSGYTNHCSPTAATNMVMYWKYARGFFTSNSSDPLVVFRYFYSKMKTNLGNSGTEWTDIWQAYADYYTAYSGMSKTVSDAVQLVTFSKIRTKLDSEIPVDLSVINYANLGNHSVNVWGYYISSDSVNYLRISDNWGSSVSGKLMNYSSYSYAQYVYYAPTT